MKTAMRHLNILLECKLNILALIIYFIVYFNADVCEIKTLTKFRKCITKVTLVIKYLFVLNATRECKLPYANHRPAVMSSTRQKPKLEVGK